jgi:MerR family transcriptional regulator/heat shock protein HspR
MRWEELNKQFDVDISPEEPVFPFNIACELLHLHYWTLHEILREGIVKPRGKAKKKKLLSYKDMKKLKIIKHLIDDEGVNIKGVKIILEMRHEI